MTRSSRLLLPAALLLMWGPITSRAATPSRALKKGDMALSSNAGFTHVADNDFEKIDTVLTGTFEYHTTPRLSWRGLLGITSFDADLPGKASVDTTFVTANVVYTWERGRIRPYVTGGTGLYDKMASSDLPARFDQTVLGVNAGGGIDWILGSRWGIQFEGTVHVLAGEAPNTVFFGTVGLVFCF
jgi:outer membrane protein with beta-barrel domain